MLRSTSTPLFATLLALTLAACFEDPGPNFGNGDGDGDGDDTTSGDGDGAPAGDGDGAPAGDGDGAPTGDGDGAPTGDGDGAPTGDGDGAPTGDGDGDGEPPVFSFSDSLCDAEISSWTANQPTPIPCNGEDMPNEGWARTIPSLMVEDAATFSNALELVTHTVNDGLIQAIYNDIDVSGTITPLLRTRVGCSLGPGTCSAFWQIVVREAGVPQPLLVQDGVQMYDGDIALVELDLTPHKDKLLEIGLFMTNNDTFDPADSIAFDNPRIEDAG